MGCLRLVPLLLALAVVVPLVAGRVPLAQAQEATPTDCPTTTEAENVALTQRWFDEVWNQGNVDVLDEILAADHAHHWAIGPDSTGIEAVKERIAGLRDVYPDFAIAAPSLIADGDLVAARWTATGTHEGAYLGMAPTGRVIEMTGINVFRIACGRIAEVWSEMNGLGVSDQLGLTEATPAP